MCFYFSIFHGNNNNVFKKNSLAYTYIVIFYSSKPYLVLVVLYYSQLGVRNKNHQNASENDFLFFIFYHRAAFLVQQYTTTSKRQRMLKYNLDVQRRDKYQINWSTAFNSIASIYEYSYIGTLGQPVRLFLTSIITQRYLK